MDTEAMKAAMDELTNLEVETFWLEVSTPDEARSEASVETTGDARCLLAHHLLTVADHLDQTLEETATESVEIAEEQFFDIEE